MFPDTDINGDHDTIIINFNVRLRKTKQKSLSPRKFNLNRLGDFNVAEGFKATIRRKFAQFENAYGSIQWHND